MDKATRNQIQLLASSSAMLHGLRFMHDNLQTVKVRISPAWARDSRPILKRGMKDETLDARLGTRDPQLGTGVGRDEDELFKPA